MYRELFFFQLYDQMAVSQITLYNSGQVALDFVSMNKDCAEEKQPGKVLVIPSRAHVKALERQEITIKYFPGVPAKFEKCFMVGFSFVKFDGALRPRTHRNVFVRFCIVYCSQGNREQPAHYLKKYKNAGKRFRVYGALVTICGLSYHLSYHL